MVTRFTIWGIGHFLAAVLCLGRKRTELPSAQDKIPCRHPFHVVKVNHLMPGSHSEECLTCGATRTVGHVYDDWRPKGFPPAHLCWPTTPVKS
ncbi:hypothetical protein [Planctomicrobium sp. SH527]|uniref:hypothetical protein n=1 Tax=Planctomicrobium sp. SH527 TaxID=3448123 RepID=UPI003F5BCE17